MVLHKPHGASRHRQWITAIEWDMYHLPENLYGLAIAEPLQLDWRIDGSVLYCVELWRGFGLLSLNYIVQTTFLVWIWRIDNQHKLSEMACHANLWSLQLELVCIFIFLVAIFVEIRETVDMFIGLWHAPVATGYSLLAAVETEQHGHHGHQGAIIMQDKPQTLFMRMGIKKDAEWKRWSLRRMTASYKALVILLVVIPKFCIGLVFTVVGGMYIIASDDEETIILNTVAVNFVLDLDEYFLYTFSTDAIMNRLSRIEGIPLGHTNSFRMVGFFFFSVVLIPALVLATIGLVMFHRIGCE